jgi:hypothetical protein
MSRRIKQALLVKHEVETCMHTFGGKTERDNLENKGIDGRIVSSINRVNGRELNLSVLE